MVDVSYQDGVFKYTLTPIEGNDKFSGLDQDLTKIIIPSHVVSLFFRLAYIWIGLTIVDLALQTW